MGWELLESWALPIVQDYWPEVTFSLLCLLIGSWWGRFRVLRRWKRRDFLSRLNVSLNTLRQGELRLRTLLEEDLRNVFHNQVAVDAVLRAARRTTEQDPLLPLRGEETWFYLNAVLNQISERFAMGFLRRDLGQPVTAAIYLLCLTRECAGSLRTQKIRAMLIRKDDLLGLPEAMPLLEQPQHATRFRTLQSLAARYKTDPAAFLEIELCV